MEMLKKHLSKLIVISIIAICVLVYFFVPSVNAKLNEIFSIIIDSTVSGDFTQLKEFVRAYGSYAMAVSFMLMVLQSVLAPLPAFVITLTNANLFGWVAGAILSWSSAMAGATLCFYISRILGRDVAEKFASKAGLKQVDEFFDKYGKNAVLICRLIPIISFDYVSYAAGLTGMSYWHFAIATGIGQLPATLIYSYVGNFLTGGIKYLVIGLLIFFSLGAIFFTARVIYMDKKKKA